MSKFIFAPLFFYSLIYLIFKPAFQFTRTLFHSFIVKIVLLKNRTLTNICLRILKNKINTIQPKLLCLFFHQLKAFCLLQQLFATKSSVLDTKLIKILKFVWYEKSA